MSEPLRAAVAGCGWGAEHLRGFHLSEHATPVAAWARTLKPHVEKVGQQYGIPIYTDYARMLADVQPDVVGVATPEDAHEAFTVQALEAGCHVYCEKVLADSVDAAQRMIDAAAKAQRMLSVGYNYRYSGSCEQLKRWLDEGRIGTPLYAQLTAFTWCIHHMTDYVCSLLGRPEAVVGRVDLEPLPDRPHQSIYKPGHLFETFAYAAYTRKAFTAEFADGVTLQAASTDYTNISEPATHLTLQGDRGRLVLDDISGNVTLFEGSRESTVYRPSQIRDRIGLGDNCVMAIDAFAQAIAKGAPAPIPAEQGLWMIQLEEAIMRSSKTRQWEPIAQP